MFKHKRYKLDLETKLEQFKESTLRVHELELIQSMDRYRKQYGEDDFFTLISYDYSIFRRRLKNTLVE